LKENDEALETPRRLVTISQTEEFNDKFNGLQSLIQMCLVEEEELKPKGDELSKCYNYLVAQVEVQEKEYCVQSSALKKFKVCKRLKIDPKEGQFSP